MTKLYRTTSSNGLRLRASPFDGNTLAVLPNNTKLTAIDEQTWVKVITPRGEVGFVLKDFLEPDITTIKRPNGIVIYESRHGALRSERDVKVHEDFVPRLEFMEKEAKARAIELFITSSLRKPNTPVTNAIVTPAKMSNHFVGHAVDLNFIFQGKWYGSRSFKEAKPIPNEICTLIEAIKGNRHLRWGGDFSTPDYIHFDDKINAQDPESYKAKLASIWGV